MAYPGQTITHPLTGERITFLRTSRETGGTLLELRSTWTGEGERAVEHQHPLIEESVEVLSGTAIYRVAGIERRLTPGNSIRIPAGTPHLGWNGWEGETALLMTFRPALRWETFIERLFELAAGEDTTAIAALFAAHVDEIRLAR